MKNKFDNMRTIVNRDVETHMENHMVEHLRQQANLLLLYLIKNVFLNFDLVINHPLYFTTIVDIYNDENATCSELPREVKLIGLQGLNYMQGRDWRADIDKISEIIKANPELSDIVDIFDKYL